jgi:hypothetical protein
VDVLITPCKVRQNSSSFSLYLYRTTQHQLLCSKQERKGDEHGHHDKQLSLAIVHRRSKRVVPRDEVFRSTGDSGVPASSLVSLARAERRKEEGGRTESA